MTNCVGVKFQRGDFKNNSGETVHYDNVILNLVTDDAAEMLYGHDVTNLKIKRSLFPAMDDKAWIDMIGKELELSYGLSSGKPVLNNVKIIK